MPTWQEIGVDTYNDAVALRELKKYRSATARFYYSVFAILTGELIAKNAAAEFRGGRATPSHLQLTALIATHCTSFSDERKANLIREVVSLYRARILADYSVDRVDKDSAQTAMRSADKVLRCFGVNHD
jgi:uncharacterized protein (UPF0332 family)